MMTVRDALATMVVVGLLCSCSSSTRAIDEPGDSSADLDGQVLVDAAVDGGNEAAGEAIVDQTKFLDGCLSFNHRCEGGDGPDCGKCQYRIRYDTSRCSPSAPCDDLFLFWAFMLCDGPNMEELLDRVRKDHPNFVTACVQPLYPGEILPVSLGAPERENEVIKELFDAIRNGQMGVWSGKNLLMAGCSHGASRYPVVAARYEDDGNWVGTHKTAVCMSEGGVSIPLQDKFIGQMVGNGGASCSFRHRRMIEGYTTHSPGASHSCAAGPGSQCACDPEHAFLPYPGDCGEGDCVSFDSIIVATGADFAFSQGVSSANFSVKNWRLVSEGSDFQDTSERCERDVIPRGPFQAMCSLVDADLERDCSFVDLPGADHCSAYMKDISTHCVDWFVALP